MADVTVYGANGGGGHVLVGFTYGSSSTLSLAQKLASAISAGVTSTVAGGTLTPFYDPSSGSALPLVTSGGGAVNTGGLGTVPGAGPAQVTLAGGYVAVVDNSSTAETITGVGDTNPSVSVIAGSRGLTFISGTGFDGGIGFGSVAAASSGVGNEVILSGSTVSTGGYVIGLGDGAGTNTIQAASGTNTIFGGSGHNLIDLSAGTIAGAVSSNNVIGLSGNDTVTATGGSGHDTIGINGAANNVLVSFGSGWTGTLLLSNTATTQGAAGADTVNGGGGSVTLFGGMAQTNFTGGTAGNNLIVNGEDGTAVSSIFGGGTGDKLYASSIGGGVIKAGAGLESLIGAGHHSNSVANLNASGPTVAGTLFIGSTVAGAQTYFYAGTGADTILFGSGTEGADGNATFGGSVYDFNSAATSIGGGASIVIYDYTVGKDSMVFSGYGETEAQIAAAATISGGNTIFRLADNTTVTVTNVTTLFSDATAKFLTAAPLVNAVDGGSVSSLTGAGGQVLLASSLGGGVLSASGGNETLIGASHNPVFTGVTNPFPTGSTVGGTVFNASAVAGSNTQIYVGTGKDTVNFGAGTQFADGNVGLGGTLYNISSALTSIGGAAHIEIKDFTVGTDTLVASTYNENSAFVQANAATIAGGNTTFTLSDGTTVQIDNVTTLFNDPNSKLQIS